MKCANEMCTRREDEGFLGLSDITSLSNPIFLGRGYIGVGRHAAVVSFL
jgi:hypothetical protein